ncbi:MAG: sensor histidine kinase [Clostridia bacterium]|nr:sensor histidine kinase [Clostridia bacterium]
MNEIGEILEILFKNIGYACIIAVFLSKISAFKRMMTKSSYSVRDVMLLSVIFGLLGIIGTLTGVETQGAIANTRIMPIVAGGILCGPTVGILSSVIAAAHRFLIDPNGITTIQCALTTLLAGIVSGTAHSVLINRKTKWLISFVITALLESFEMFMIYFTVKPPELGAGIVNSIFLPMSLTNSIGVMLLILIIDDVFYERDMAAAKQAQISMSIANKTLNYIKNGPAGFNEACEIIKKDTGADAVSITDKFTILAHAGEGGDHHLPGNPIMTQSTRDAIKTGEIEIMKSKSEINCRNLACPLQSAIIIPLYNGQEIIGTLKIYYRKENNITEAMIEMANGLGHLISNQLELSKVNQFKEAASQSELKALQSQINPHFLFNSLNTISYLIRTEPEKARDIVQKLASHMRYNLQTGTKLINVYDEIKHMNDYLSIEKARFGDKINFISKIEKGIEMTMPALIIQPLVENCLKHAFNAYGNRGTIELEVKSLDEDKIQIAVTDDGCGIEQKIIDAIQNDAKTSERVGLTNVNQRLVLLYGHGLNIETIRDESQSKAKHGTRISFIIERKKL